MPDCLISLGGNLGDRGETLRDAARQIAALDGVQSIRSSRLYATPAIGGPPDQPPFLNAAVRITTEIPASELLPRLQQLEHDAGRVRQQRWSARPIDLDIILYGDLIGDRRFLSVPHPRYTARKFVLMPAAEVAGDMVDPRFGWSIASLAASLADAVPSAVLVGGSRSLRQTLLRSVAGSDVDIWTGGPANAGGDRSIQLPDQPPPQPWLLDADQVVAAAAGSKPHWSTRPRLWMRLMSQPSEPTLSPIDTASIATAMDVGHYAGRSDWFDRPTDQQPWPSPHQIWNRGRSQPEYGLEFKDVIWAGQEIASALRSMNCDCQPAGALLPANP